ncbi:MAG: UvrB/UvrC motif-containing protein [bacterium]|nr:UvrB/UvrC motif-containing protein [bacterium]MDD6225149.1 UvrB/UvrC motif-containing protein [bacterium]MDY3861770.1 UvrB/UvrC motif-containing protein [Ruminococcus sp.]
MKCQKCGMREATTHIKTMINGEYAEYDLCPKCAEQMGYNNIFSDMESEFNNFLGSFFGNALPARTQATRCESCGSTYNEIAKTGQVGCADCYDVFFDQLMPLIRRIHGNTAHCGKTPHSIEYTCVEDDKAPNNAPKDKAEQINELKAQLQEAVNQQNFEKAAQLRDKIKEMENE